jgi:hypothetical protein
LAAAGAFLARFAVVFFATALRAVFLAAVFLTAFFTVFFTAFLAGFFAAAFFAVFFATAFAIFIPYDFAAGEPNFREPVTSTIKVTSLTSCAKSLSAADTPQTPAKRLKTGGAQTAGAGA